MNGPQFLVDLCRHIGQRTPYWTQGGGGNVSLKVGSGELWIKASGFRLDAVSAEAGTVPVSLGGLREFLWYPWPEREGEVAYAQALVRFSDSRMAARASMETGFHALLEMPVVAHFHSLTALLMAHVHERNPALLLQACPDLAGAVFLPAIRPGWLLSKAVVPQARAEAIILANHGVILQGSEDGFFSLMDDWMVVEKAFCRHFGFANVLSLYEAEDALAFAMTEWASVACPMKIYFPDTAVFRDRLQGVVEPAATRGLYKLKPDALFQDRSAVELWLATVALYLACPDLKELPLEISGVVRDLPTEQFRRQQEGV